MAVQRDRMGKAIAYATARFGIEGLKPEQEKAIRTFVDGNDVFVCLPTGYGKSLGFALLPYVYDDLRGTGPEPSASIVVCVVPLQLIMTDQYERFTEHGLAVEVVGGTGHQEEDASCLGNVRDGKAQLVYISPEALLTNLHWRELLRSQVCTRKTLLPLLWTRLIQ